MSLGLGWVCLFGGMALWGVLVICLCSVFAVSVCLGELGDIGLRGGGGGTTFNNFWGVVGCVGCVGCVDLTNDNNFLDSLVGKVVSFSLGFLIVFALTDFATDGFFLNFENHVFVGSISSYAIRFALSPILIT